ISVEQMCLHPAKLVIHVFLYCIALTSTLSILIFFSMTNQPPRSTLFPYTTLFRSAVRQALPAQAVTTPGKGSPLAARRTGSSCRDRKSTRLNSSHQIISYAVFCLKKKNTHSPKNSLKASDGG